ncbi:2648_t:CDS:1, partial [Ambispora gerdemannii]
SIAYFPTITISILDASAPTPTTAQAPNNILPNKVTSTSIH